MRIRLFVAAFGALALTGTASAEAPANDYPEGSFGYEAMLSADYAAAEAEIRSDYTAGWNDPARLINLGQIMARTGRHSEARRLLKRAMHAEDTEIVLVDGRLVKSRKAARQAYDALKPIQLSSR